MLTKIEVLAIFNLASMHLQATRDQPAEALFFGLIKKYLHMRKVIDRGVIESTRTRLNLTQKEAADVVGITQRMWSYYEQGVHKINPKMWEFFLIKTGEVKQTNDKS